ncbi:MAG: hypothetical protein DRP85_06490 [Candidatus Makaraimicrobium thalassicum]|nr:MAG: hypothetical protein DRP85_06490 [Candidatus Omnitrophota bacterium]
MINQDSSGSNKPYAWNATNDNYKNIGSDVLRASNKFGGQGWMDAGSGSNAYQYNYSGGDGDRTLSLRNKANPQDAQTFGIGNYGDYGNMSNEQLGNPGWDTSGLGKMVWGGGDQTWNNDWGGNYGMDRNAGPALNPAPINPSPVGKEYNPPYPNPPMEGDPATAKGLGNAAALIDQQMQNPRQMPGFWGDQYQSQDPEYWSEQFPGQVGNATLGTAAIPEQYKTGPEYQATKYEGAPAYQQKGYNGMMGGDYNALQSALQKPGEIAAQNAYERGSRDLRGYMGNSGMYGSSVMSQQANEGVNREFMNASAANAASAAATRYGQQQQDLQYGNSANMQDRQFANTANRQDLQFGNTANRQDSQFANTANRQDRQFGADFGLQRADLDRQQKLDKWKADTTNAGLDRDYQNQQFQFDYGNSEAARGERNAMLQAQYGYDQQKMGFDQMQQENLLNQNLALAGRAQTSSQMAQNYRAQQDAMKAQETSNKWGLGTDLLGGFFGMGQSGGFGNSMASGLWNSIKSS